MKTCFVKRPFIDSLRIYVKGGTGGRGLPRYGGHGGRGGHVYLTGCKNASLKNVLQINPKLRFIAGVGSDSRRTCLVGEPGEDIEIKVPPGVVAKGHRNEVLGEVNDDGETVLVAKGADGSYPGNGYAQLKSKGFGVNLDLKLIADVGLVGFPNAGKSTILGALSRATPKVAAYPFTTLRPNIGTMYYEDTRQIKVADLPGLIEGAHINIGMGHKFLKHVERTKLLLFMIDLTGFRLNATADMRSPFETIILLMKELELYGSDLCTKPAVLALNKIDLPGTEKTAEEVKHKLNHLDAHLHEIAEPLWPENPIKFEEVVTISAAKQQGTEELKLLLRDILDEKFDEKRDENSSEITNFDRKLANALREHHGSTLL